MNISRFHGLKYPKKSLNLWTGDGHVCGTLPAAVLLFEPVLFFLALALDFFLLPGGALPVHCEALGFLRNEKRRSTRSACVPAKTHTRPPTISTACTHPALACTDPSFSSRDRPERSRARQTIISLSSLFCRLSRRALKLSHCFSSVKVNPENSRRFSLSSRGYQNYRKLPN